LSSPFIYGGGVNQLLIWYDAGCPLCRREIALMRRLDRAERICFIAIDEKLQSCPIDSATLLKRFHACEDGTMLSGAAAFAAMWRAIPLLRPLGLAAKFLPFLWLLERLYRLFLKGRPALQRLAHRLSGE
jgi:predicted DCC family thiol-disulfide oxidoreductase YuxK